MDDIPSFFTVDKTRADLFDLLVVDDDHQVSLVVLAEILRREGYRVRCAASGRECLGAITEKRPDMVILDIWMPEMDGFETCRRIRRQYDSTTLPVIFITGDLEDQTISRAFDAGGNDYLRKPVNPVEITARIEATLSRLLLNRRIIEDARVKTVLATAGAVCHELNQPLQAMMLSVNILAMDAAMPTGILKKIESQVERMGEITGKLMRLTDFHLKPYLNDLEILDIDRSSTPGRAKDGKKDSDT